METRERTFPRGILFDMDGTLLSETETSDQSWQKVCFQVAPQYNLSPEILSQAIRESYVAYKNAIKDDAEKQRRDRLDPFAVRVEMVEEALARVGKKDSPGVSAMVRAYEALREAHRQLTPHALDTLQTLQAKGIRLALLTNGNASYQRRKIQQHHLAPLFDFILVEEEFGAAKSDTRIYQYALAQLHLAVQEAWMVGDDLAMDVAIPQQLGILAIWFDPMRRGLPQHSLIHPDRIIHNLPELLELLAGMPLALNLS
jgi:putative hydrolase of the HAD superfamily